MSSWCVQGYPIGRVKRIKGGRTYDQPFLISTRAPPIPTVTTVVRVCVEDTTGFYVSLRSTTLSSRLRPTIHPFVSAHGIEQRVSSSFSRSRIKRFFSKRITNIETGMETWDLERLDLKVEHLSIHFVFSRKGRETVSSLYVCTFCDPCLTR